MRYRNLAISLLFILAMVFAIRFTLLHLQNTVNLAKNEEPDAIMEDVHAVILNKQGKISMKIDTPRLLHFYQHDASILLNPEITIYRNTLQPWYITAKHAKTFSGVDKIDFWDDVTVYHYADQGTPATIIKSPTLTFYPEKKLAETAAFITMTQPSLVVKGMGMHADIKSGDVKLLADARGEYVPSN